MPSLTTALRALHPGQIVNLDVKADVFMQAWDIVIEEGKQGQVLMKSRAAPGSRELNIIQSAEEAMFMPILVQCETESAGDCTDSPSATLAGYMAYDPVAVEVIFTDDAFLLDTVSAAVALGLPVWVNTLAPQHAAGRTDEMAQSDPDAAWGELIDYGVRIIQTDKPEQLRQYVDDKRSRQ